MSLSPLGSRTYLPRADQPLGAVHDFIQAHGYAAVPLQGERCFLAGPGPDDRVELPEEVYDVLRQVVEAMRSGLAVTVAPVSQSVSTTQAAELLGVSRPTVVKLLEEGAMAFEQVRSHRKILLRDVLDYRRTRREQQYAALEAMADEDDDEPLEEMLKRLRTTRRTLAERRLSATS